VQLGDRTYKNHLDGYNQMALLDFMIPFKQCGKIIYFDDS
jgi:hypothetical protein